jgi:predicted ABC-type ATPase
MVKKPRLVIFGGPNGSGKSTIIAEQQVKPGFPKRYINADDVAKTMFADVQDADTRNLAAAQEAQRQRFAALESGESFAFETVMSTPGKLALISEAQQRGYHVDLFFVSTRDPSINRDRVKQRVLKGGHSVNPVKIVERYHRCLELLPSAFEMASAAAIVDNSEMTRTGDPAPRIGVVKDGTVELNSPQQDLSAWIAAKLLAPALSRALDREALYRRYGVAHPAVVAEGTTYEGEVVEITMHHVVQDVGAGLIIHDRSILGDTVKRKSKQAIAYHYAPNGFLAPSRAR